VWTALAGGVALSLRAATPRVVSAGRAGADPGRLRIP